MVATWRWALLPFVLAAGPLRAQSEAQLRQYFEGKRVTLKIAMPGTEEGVDVYPGTEIRAGNDAMITKIRVKSKHIEFQLDGGGYGTMSDETSTSVSVPSTPKSKRESNLEAELKRERDPVRRRELKEELDDLQHDREREDARNRAEVADAVEQKKQNIRQRRLEGGSRFNVRYRDLLPDEVLTPTGLEAALAEYVTFPSLPVNALASNGGDQPVEREDPVAAQPPRSGLPRKGMTGSEAAELLGEPVQSSERAEGTLRVVTRTYRSSDGQVTAEFVEDVLFRYSVTSN